jgi:hypothetical protein
MNFKKPHRLMRCSILLALALYFSAASAIFKEIMVGYGFGKEVGRSYTNNGTIINTILFQDQLDPKLKVFFGPSIAYWHADTSSHSTLFTGAASIGFRAYFTSQSAYYRPFLQIASGPCLISKKIFGSKTQGSLFLFQDRLGAGMEIGTTHNTWLVTLEYTHYSNGGLSHPNPGFNIPMVGSLGYAF